MCIFTALIMDKSCSIPQILSPSPRYYRGFYPHSRRNTAVFVPITAVITAITAVLPPSLSPCHSLLWSVTLILVCLCLLVFLSEEPETDELQTDRRTKGRARAIMRLHEIVTKLSPVSIQRNAHNATDATDATDATRTQRTQ